MAILQITCVVCAVLALAWHIVGAFLLEGYEYYATEQQCQHFHQRWFWYMGFWLGGTGLLIFVSLICCTISLVL